MAFPDFVMDFMGQAPPQPLAPPVAQPLPDWTAPIFNQGPPEALPAQAVPAPAFSQNPLGSLPAPTQVPQAPTDVQVDRTGLNNQERSAALNQAAAAMPSASKPKTSRQGIQQQEQLGRVEVASASEAADLAQQAQAKEQDALANAAAENLRGIEESNAEAQKMRATAAKAAAAKMAAVELRADQLAKAEPNPGRLWSNMSSWGKANFLLGTLAYSLATSRLDITAANPMLMEFRRMVDQDVAFQQQTNQKLIANNQQQRQAIIQQKNDDLDEASRVYVETATRLAAADRYLQQLAKGAGRDERRLAGIAATRAELAKMSRELTDKQTNMLFSREQKAADHAHAARMATVAWERAQAAEKAKAAAASNEDLRELSPELGLKIIKGRDDKKNPIIATKKGIDGKEIPQTQLHKDYIKEAGEAAANANKLRMALQRVQRKLGTMDNTDALLKKDAQYNQDIQLIGRYLATDPTFNKGVTSNADVAQGGRVAEGRAEGGVVEMLSTLGSRRDMALSAVSHYLTNQADLVNTQLAGIPTPDGNTLHWTPTDLPEEAPNTDAYQVPGEKEQKLAMSADVEAGIPLTRQPGSEALTDAGFAPGEPVPRYTPKTRLAPLTPEERSTVKALEVETKGMTSRSLVNIVNSKLPSSDARQRFFRANEEKIDKVQEQERKVADELVVRSGLLTNAAAPLPTNQEIRRMMEAGGFPAGKMRPEDYEYIRNLVDERAEMKRQSRADYSAGAGVGRNF